MRGAGPGSVLSLPASSDAAQTGGDALSLPSAENSEVGNPRRILGKTSSSVLNLPSSSSSKLSIPDSTNAKERQVPKNKDKNKQIQCSQGSKKRKHVISETDTASKKPKCSLDLRTIMTDRLSLPSCSEELKGGSDKRKSKNKQNEAALAEPFVWTCPYCHLEITAPTTKKRSERRSNHLKYRHKDRKLGALDTNRVFLPPTPTSQYIPLDQRSWTCPICKEGLPDLAKWPKEKSIRHHWETQHPGLNSKEKQKRWKKERWEAYRRNPDADPVLQQMVEKWRDIRKIKYAKVKNHRGHKTVLFRPDWDTLQAIRGSIRGSKVFESKAVTCAKCWKFQFRSTWTTSSRGGKDRKKNDCNGKPNFHPGRYKNWMEIRQKSPKTVDILCQIWKTKATKVDVALAKTKEQATQDYQMLVAQGIEPNPGPNLIKCVTLNTQGAKGTWKALDVMHDFDILLLQETCMNQKEMAAFGKAAYGKGFRAYSVAGKPCKDRWGNMKPNHGVTTLVKNSLSQKHVVSSQEDQNGSFQTVVIQAGGWIVVNTYNPPRDMDTTRQSAAAQLDLFRAGKIASTRAWVWAGDFNHEPGKNAPFTEAAAVLGADLLPFLVGTPTRWNSNRTVDHIYSNKINLVSLANILELEFSDHEPISFALSHDWTEETLRYVMPNRGMWTCPDQITKDEWTQALDDAWHSLPVVRDLKNRLQQNQEPQINEEWDHFNRALCQTFEQVQKMQNQNIDVKIEKGQAAQVVLVPKRKTTDSGNMQSRKRLRFLARACTFLRKLGNDPNFKSSPEFAKLCQRIQYKSLAELQQRILHTEQMEELYRNSHRYENLNRWRNNMRSDLNARNTWVKSQNRGCPPVVMSEDTERHTNTEVIDAIRKHWQEVWNEAKRISPASSEAKMELIKQYLGPQIPDNGVSRPTETDLFSAVASLKQGSCGTDQWYPSEIKVLPFSILRMFWDLTKRWEVVATTPETLQEIRQVNIPKTHKISSQNSIQCADLRPIAVCSIWWRLYTSTWSKSQSLRLWRAQNIPPSIAGGKNMPGAEDLAAELYDNFNRQGFVGTMDYSMCFDHVCPKIATETMQWLGIPETLTKTLCYNWERQKRFLVWQQCTNPEPLHTKLGIPQGDGLSPLALSCLIYAGLRYVQAKSGQHEGFCIYMDDRSWTANNPQKVVEIARFWEEWCPFWVSKRTKIKPNLGRCRRKNKKS